MSEQVTQMAGSPTSLCQAWRKLRLQVQGNNVTERKPVRKRRAAPAAHR